MESQCYQKVIRLCHSPWLCLVTFLKLKTETKNLIKSLFSVNSLTCQKICAVREKNFWHQPKMITFCGNLCEKNQSTFTICSPVSRTCCSAIKYLRQRCFIWSVFSHLRIRYHLVFLCIFRCAKC